MSRDGRSAPRRYPIPEDDPPGTSRLFIAVPVADEVRRAVGELMERVADGPVDVRAAGQPRWVRVEGLHLTLRFLGATPDDRQLDLARILESTAGRMAPFNVTLSGAGAFPNAHRPRVLWLGIVEGVTELTSLADRLNGHLAEAGWPSEDRPFAPHLTVARTDGIPNADEKARRLTEMARELRLSWQADRLTMYRSLRGHGPARYEVVTESSLT